MNTSKLVIPPRPGVLIDIQSQINAEEPCVQSIANLIKQDVSLYAVLLSAVNSPWMGLSNPVENVEKAITIMGLEKVFTLLQAVIVRSCFKDNTVLESFWGAATEVASISDDLAKRYKLIGTENAYSAGMLHNAGVPIMITNFDNYSDFIAKNAHRPANEQCVLERQDFGTDHFLQGALMAKSWYMSGDVSLAIRYQPIAQSILEGKKDLPATVVNLLAILTLAKGISNEYRNYWNASDEDQSNSIEASLNYLKICDTEYSELKEDIMDDMLDTEVA